MVISGVGLRYRSLLTVPSKMYSGVETEFKMVPGMRLPPFGITRMADWQSVDLQDLAGSDGVWKVIFFVGRGFDLEEVREKLGGVDMKKVRVCVVLDAKVEESGVHWTNVSEGLTDWKK